MSREISEEALEKSDRSGRRVIAEEERERCDE